MTHRSYFEAFDEGCKRIMEDARIFGGKVVVFGGDFRQCSPIKRGATPSQILDITLKRSKLWSSFSSLHLTINMRALPEELEFKDWALRLGDGVLQSETPGCIDIPPQCLSEKGVVEEVFGEAPTRLTKREMQDHIILTPLNEHAVRLNNQVVENIAGELLIARSIDRVAEGKQRSLTCYSSLQTFPLFVHNVPTFLATAGPEEANFPLEFIHSMMPDGFPPHKLHLKPGAIVMLIRNLDVKRHLCNGTRFIVRHISRRVLTAEFASGARRGQRVALPRIYFIAEEKSVLPVVFTRLQFPVRGAFAMTIKITGTDD